MVMINKLQFIIKNRMTFLNQGQAVRIFLLMSILTTLLSACSSDMTDLEEKVKELKARQNPKVDPLPTFEPVESFFYEADKLRDPFEPLLDKKAMPSGSVKITNANRNCPQPDQFRVRQELEKLPLDSLKMVGTLQDEENNLWGLVSSIEGTVYRIKVGDYIGEYFGRIINISEQVIELEEMRPTDDGCWENAMAKLVLSN